jgi:hypothetical protein
MLGLIKEYCSTNGGEEDEEIRGKGQPNGVEKWTTKV